MKHWQLLWKTRADAAATRGNATTVARRDTGHASANLPRRRDWTRMATPSCSSKGSSKGRCSNSKASTPSPQCTPVPLRVTANLLVQPVTVEVMAGLAVLDSWGDRRRTTLYLRGSKRRSRGTKHEGGKPPCITILFWAPGSPFLYSTVNNHT